MLYFFIRLLKKASDKWAISWQNKYGSSLVPLFEGLAFYVNDYVVGGLSIFLFVIAKKKSVSIRYIAYISMIIYHASLFQMMYADPRPFMRNSQIQVYECQLAFGKPSGHAMNGFIIIAAFLYLYVSPLYNIEFAKKANYSDSQNDHRIKLLSRTCKIIVIVLWIIGMLLIAVTGISRIYLGDHSLDQVIIGWVIGIISFASIVTPLEGLLKEFNTRIITIEKSATELFSWFIGLYFLHIILAIVIFEIQTDVTHYQPIWIQNIQQKCGVQTGEILLSVSFVTSSTISFGAGIYAGYMAMRRFYAEYETIERRIWWIELLGNGVGIGGIIMFYVCLGLVPQNSNVYLTYFIPNSLRYFLMAFTLALVPALIMQPLYQRKSKKVTVERNHKTATEIV